MVSGPCCTRVEKQAAALKAKGWRVDSLSWHPPKDASAFDQVLTCQQKRMAEHIASNGASVVHVHNEPDSLMRQADIGVSGRPVVYDCHDLEYHREGSVTDDERFAFARADGIINVGEAYRDLAYSLHPWHVPEAVVHSLPFRATIPTAPARREFAVVYEGGVLPPSDEYHWRDLTVPCSEFFAAGIRLDIFCAPTMANHYPNVRGYLPYAELMRTLSTYEFGFVGADPMHEKFMRAYPNKLMEYAACGVIPLIVNAPAAAAYFGSGIVADSTREAIALLRECDTEAMRRDVYAHARFMDDEIAGVIGLYESLGGR